MPPPLMGVGFDFKTVSRARKMLLELQYPKRDPEQDLMGGAEAPSWTSRACPWLALEWA
jgi:hypothetical protein